MSRYFIKLAYKGTNLHGWQIQPNAKTVQGELNNALGLLLKSNVNTIGCGRTDTGVHASEFFAHFDTDKDFDTKHVVYKLNHILIDDIAIYDIFKVSNEFHARFSADARTYFYEITSFKDPFSKELALFYPFNLDLDLMNEASRLLLEYKDFECFCKVGAEVNHFLCNVMEANWSKDDHKIRFTIKANRFLRNMVRAIVGTLLEVGQHKISIEEFKKIIESKDRSNAGKSIAAKGLYLAKIDYPKE